MSNSLILTFSVIFSTFLGFVALVIFLTTFTLSGFFSITFAGFVQIKGQTTVENLECSYLDPITIDMLAFLVALFLIVEGFYKIFQNKNAKFQKQFTRSIRIGMGFAILTIHIMQFIHK